MAVSSSAKQLIDVRQYLSCRVMLAVAVGVCFLLIWRNRAARTAQKTIVYEYEIRRGWR